MELKRIYTAAAILSSAFAPFYSAAASFELPIWKSEAEARGYVLPKAFGISIGYMHVEQGINVNSIALNGLRESIRTPDIPGFCLIESPLNPDKCLWDFPGKPGEDVAVNDIIIDTKGGFQESDVITLRADMWLFPFLNLYGIVGKINGTSETTIDVALDLGEPGNPFTIVKGAPFSLDLDGNMYGAGIVLAGGYKEWFTIVDASYTQTSLTVIDGNIDSIVVTPRVGFDFTNYGHPIRLWVGGQYQNIQQTLKGDLRDLFPANLVNAIEKSGETSGFEVKQELESEWNTVVGFNYVINPTFNVIGEFGFGDRQSSFISLDARF
jgi:hypothetical protein